MSHSAEQMRQKKEAMANAANHAKNSTVDGSSSPRYSMDIRDFGDSLKSKTMRNAEDMVQDAKAQGLKMEIEK